MSKPEVNAEAVRWVYHSGYWDGPLSGVVVVNGERLWTRCTHEADDEERTRTYDLIRKPPEWWEKEDEKHALFREHVGTHTNYFYENGKRSRKIGAVKPQAEWAKFYDKYPPHQDPEPECGEVVGWWQD